ncbi:MAG TPA: vanadium-dependent haloperoxidase [Gemmatimonadaceae bacterium]|nr:vanadium-dependent haloperoxidase [Gemmatimonadaceae bacterium]
MRIPTPLLVLPLLIVYPERAVLTTQLHATLSTARPAADSISCSVRWNRLVPQLVDEATARRRAARTAAKAAGDSAELRRIAQTPPPILFRVYTLLSVAQYAAVNSAATNPAVSSDAAVASASAAVLTELFTDSAVRASIARELARDIEQARVGSRGAERAVASKTLGEDVAHHVIAWAPPPASFAAPWNGTIPKGPGMWYTSPGVPPIGIALIHARPWLLDSASQFRPAAPPAYGSPTFKAALEEVRRVARERTAEQTSIAQRWNASDPWARWNQVAADALRRHHASDAEAARVFAVLNAAASDAIIACFDAKYFYWTIRPSQEDTTLVLADSVDLPNFPSYPSGHACSAGAFDATLGHFFPQDRAEFTRIAEEQAMSRLYGGIHYRFDNDGGLALGRIVARYVVERERRGALNAWRSSGVASKP